MAVLDSGIDYTHADLGGGGTLADYEAAYGYVHATIPVRTRHATDSSRPPRSSTATTSSVSIWPNDRRPGTPIRDPIDFEGHGTHVADIIGGVGGVAPGVDLYAVKVCSAVSSTCSGIALIQGMEFAVDPER